MCTLCALHIVCNTCVLCALHIVCNTCVLCVLFVIHVYCVCALHTVCNACIHAALHVYCVCKIHTYNDTVCVCVCACVCVHVCVCVCVVCVLLQARETLAEIPSQFTAYMKANKIRPNPPPLRQQRSSFINAPGEATGESLSSYASVQLCLCPTVPLSNCV